MKVEFKMTNKVCFRRPRRIMLLFFAINTIMIIHESVPVNALETIMVIAVVNAIMAGALGLYYANLRELNYLVIDDTGLTIRERLLVKGIRIEFNDIDAVLEYNDVIRIRLKSGFENRLMLDLIDLDGVRALKHRLEAECSERIIR